MNPGPDAGSGSGSSAVVVFERVFAPGSPNQRVYFGSVVSELPTSGTIDRNNARQFTEDADVETFDGAIFIRLRQSNTMTRYSVSSDRQLIQEGQFSFQNTGLPTRRFSTAYLTPTRAYLIDNVGWRLIEWNPTTMALTGNEVSIAEMSKGMVTTPPAPNSLPNSSISLPVRVGNRVIAGVGWENTALTPPTIHSAVGAMIIDPNAPSLATLIEDPRLGRVHVASVGADQDVFLSGALGAAAKFATTVGGGMVPPSGMTRIARDASQFDAAEIVNVTAITGSPAIIAIHRVDATHLLVQMWDPSVSIDTYTTPTRVNEASEYMFGLVDTQAKTWNRVDTIQKGSANNTLNHRLDGTLFVQNDPGTPDAATVYAVTATGVTPTFTVPSGDLWFVTRIR